MTLSSAQQASSAHSDADSQLHLQRLMGDCLLLFISALTLFGYFLSRPQTLADGDTGWHVAVGKWIIGYRTVPQTDILSYTAKGQAWTAHEWLADVLMGAAHSLAGWAGVLLLYALFMAALGWVLAHYIRRWMNAKMAAFVIAWVSLGLMPFMIARPHVMAWLPLAMWTVLLLRARDDGRVPSLWGALIITLWANLHGSFVFGFVLLGPFAAEALIAAPAAARLKVFRDWTIFGLVSLLAAVITPYGLHGLLFPFQLTAMPIMASIAEWMPSNFSSIGLFEVLLLSALGACLWLGVRIPAWRLAIVLGVLHMALAHTRHQAIFYIVTSVIVAAPLARALGRRDQRFDLGTELAASRREVMPLLAIMGALALGAIGWRLATPAQLPDGQNVPATAVANLPPELLQARVLNEYCFGGALALAGVPVFIDGRADMYGGDAVRDYLDLVDRPTRERWQQANDRWGFEWTILPPDAALAKFLDQQAGWHRIYADDWAVIHVSNAQWQKMQNAR